MNRLSLASPLMILGGITGLFATAQSSPNGLIQVNLINDSTLAVSSGTGNQKVTLMDIECGEVATVKNKGKARSNTKWSQASVTTAQIRIRWLITFLKMAIH